MIVGSVWIRICEKGFDGWRLGAGGSGVFKRRVRAQA